MVNPVSALANQLAPGRFGEPDECGVIIEEVIDFNLYQLAAWPQTLAKVATLAAQTLSFETAPGPGKLVAADQARLMRVEPLKWWLLIARSSNFTLPAIEPDVGCALDLSHSRTWLRLQGPKASILLNHFLPIDLRASASLQGCVHSTAFHHVGITLALDNDCFNLFLPRSFAVSLWEQLYDSSLQYGLEVRPAIAFEGSI